MSLAAPTPEQRRQQALTWKGKRRLPAPPPMITPRDRPPIATLAEEVAEAASPKRPRPCPDETHPCDRLVISEQASSRVVKRGSGNFINKAACKKFIMGYSDQTRHHKFTRLDAAIYDELNCALRQTMRAIVARNPSIGKTIR